MGLICGVKRGLNDVLSGRSSPLGLFDGVLDGVVGELLQRLPESVEGLGEVRVAEPVKRVVNGGHSGRLWSEDVVWRAVVIVS